MLPSKSNPIHDYFVKVMLAPLANGVNVSIVYLLNDWCMNDLRDLVESLSPGTEVSLYYPGGLDFAWMYIVPFPGFNQEKWATELLLSKEERLSA